MGTLGQEEVVVPIVYIVKSWHGLQRRMWAFKAEGQLLEEGLVPEVVMDFPRCQPRSDCPIVALDESKEPITELSTEST